MKNISKSFVYATLAALFLCIASPLSGEDAEGFLQGKVYFLDQEDVSLAKRFELAQREFKKIEKGDYYLTGYAYLSRHQTHFRGRWPSSKPIKITAKNNKIRISFRKCTSTEEGSGLAAVLFLHNVSKNKGKIVDARVIGMDQCFEFPEIPIYWLGDAEGNESLSFCKGLFESGSYNLRKTLVFVISSHDDPKACNFLRKVALGDYAKKIKESAIFWLGNYPSKKSIDYLKEIYKKEKDSKLRKQVVFALHISDQDGAVSELVKIAKTDASRKVRKNAIFWLGQKASEECVKALKDFVEKDENIEVKESAVFAISQLPKEKAVPMLIDIARSNKSPSIRKKAIFWLGQTDSEEALQFFEEILLKK